MASTKDQVQTALSEVRTLVLGAQVLLGFQQQAVFQPRFAALPGPSKLASAGALLLLLLVVACLVAPMPLHRLAERGEATRRAYRYAALMLKCALAPFALALGADVAVATDGTFGAGAAVALGAVVAVLALLFWYGGSLMRRDERPEDGRPSGGEGDGKAQPAPLKEKVTELLTEARIVLPGVQALLGFQLAAYLTQPFADLPAASKAVHTGSLLLLVVAMVLLMTPAPLHRLAEGGEHTERFERTGTRLVLAALVPLALALAGDAYVVLAKASGSGAAALACAAVAAGGMLLLWFGVPVLVGRTAAAPKRRGS